MDKKKIKQFIEKIILLPSRLYNVFVFKLRRVQKGSNSRVLGRILVRGKGKIILGDNVVINSSLFSNPIGGSTRTILFAKENAKIIIGNNVGISNSALVAQLGIFIGDNVLIGANCKIYDNDFHPIDFEQRMQNLNEKVKTKPVFIKDGAFIGAHSIILKGVTIGEKSIIGAGSVVTKSVPDGEIWAGNPAVFVKKYKI